MVGGVLERRGENEIRFWCFSGAFLYIVWVDSRQNGIGVPLNNEMKTKKYLDGAGLLDSGQRVNKHKTKKYIKRIRTGR